MEDPQAVIAARQCCALGRMTTGQPELMTCWPALALLSFWELSFSFWVLRTKYSFVFGTGAA